jgi:lipopolysaccharide transport system permease protein
VSSAADLLREDQAPERIGKLSSCPETEPVANPFTPSADDLPLTIIERRPGWQIVNLRELWRYHELLFFLTWRDVKVRYKQTVLGAAWAVLQPLATMVVFVLFLGRVGGIADNIRNYSLFVFAGLLPWTFFANAISSAGQSVVGSQNLVTKVYFPRLIIPMGAVGAGLVDFVITFAMLLVMMPFYHVWPSWNMLLAPLILLVLIIAALGVGTLLSALTVAYRDFRYVVPFSVQLWMFATPCIYLDAATVVGPRGTILLPLNPAYGLIHNFRQAMLGKPFDWYALSVSSAMSVALLLVGCLYFRRVERNFADII